MGFVYRKSVQAGPFRSNLSKSGAGLPGSLSWLDRDHPFNLTTPLKLRWHPLIISCGDVQGNCAASSG